MSSLTFSIGASLLFWLPTLSIAITFIFPSAGTAISAEYVLSEFFPASTSFIFTSFIPLASSVTLAVIVILPSCVLTYVDPLASAVSLSILTFTITGAVMSSLTPLI